MADRDWGDFGPPRPGEASGADKLLVQDAENPTQGYNESRDALAAFVAQSSAMQAVLAGLQGVTPTDRQLLNRLAAQGVHFRGAGPTLPEDVGPEEAFVKTDASGGMEAGLYVAASTPGARSTSTEGSLVLAAGGGPQGDGLLMSSEVGLAAEVSTFGWEDMGPDSFRIDLSNLSMNPGFLSVQFGADAASLANLVYFPLLTDQGGGSWRAEGELASRDGVEAGTAYTVRLTAQTAVFTTETVAWSRVDISGTDGTDGWTPVWASEADGQRRLLRITDWTGGTGTKPAVGYVSPTGLVAAKATATDFRGPAGADGAGSATVPDFADQADAIAGTVADEIMSPLTVKEAIDDRYASGAEVTAGTDGKLVDAADLKGVRDASDPDTKVQKVARIDVTDAQLSDADKEAWARRVGDDSGTSGVWVQAAFSGPYTQGAEEGILTDTGVVLDASTTELRIEWTDRAANLPASADYTRILNNAALTRLRAGTRRRPSSALLNADGTIELQFGPVDDTEQAWVALSANDTVLIASDESQGEAYGARLSQRESRTEPWAQRGNTEPIPAGKLANSPFTPALKAKLDGTEAGAQVNVKADLAERNTRSDAFVLGQSDFQTRVVDAAAREIGGRVASLPAPLPTSAVKDVGQETAERRDAVLTMAMSGDSNDDDVYWGRGRGTLAAPLGEDGEAETAAWNAAVGAVRWESDSRTLTVWLAQNSEWDRAWINDEAHLLIEGGANTVPWDPAAQAQRTNFRVASVPLSTVAATAIDDDPANQIKLNFGDTDSTPEAFPVGAPFVREAVVEDRQTAAQVQAAVDEKSDVEIRWVDSASDRPAGHETDNRVYLYWPA